MVDEVTVRCVNQACRRAHPRPVAFCPFCGRAQQGRPVPAAVPVAAAASTVPPPQPVPLATLAETVADTAAETTAAPVSPTPQPQPQPQPQPNPAKPTFKLNFGRKPMRIPELAPELAYRPASRPGPRPIRKRTWLMVVMILVAIWLFAKPRAPEKVFAGRVDEAMALIENCKLDQAKTALMALKAAKAPPAQLVRVQNALREAGPVCLKKRARANAWGDTSTAVEALLQASSFERAAARLSAFARRWGDDSETTLLRGKIDGAYAARLLDEADACLARKDRVCLESNVVTAEKLNRPELASRIAALREALSKLLQATVLDAPPGAANGAPPVLLSQPPKPPPVISTAPSQQMQQMQQQAQQKRATLAAARQDMAQSNYRAAIDRLEPCAAVLDTTNRECQSLQQQAERLNTDMLRCLANNRTWMDGRCL